MRLTIIMELQLKYEIGYTANDEKMITYLSYLTETIKNMSLHMNDKSGRFRYSPRIINISISLFTRSKTGYEEMRKLGLMMLPIFSSL